VVRLLARKVSVAPAAAAMVVLRPGATRIRRSPSTRTAGTFAESAFVTVAWNVRSQALVNVTWGAGVHSALSSAYRATGPEERLVTEPSVVPA
jgi:hypothetical protein